MPSIPSYEEHPVPADLKPFISRILYLNYTDSTPIIIPARPTGRVYIGWLASGKASATADGQIFYINGGDVHISGQLTVFDANYSLESSVEHYLAEFTTVGAFMLLDKNIGDYTNCCEVFASDFQFSNNMTSFLAFLRSHAATPIAIDPIVETAVNKIESSLGDISITNLANELGISSRHLRREFIKYIGIAPKPYALIRKVVLALHTMSTNPDLNISDLVHAAGFYDQAHLTKMFQLYLRASPKSLRLDDDGVLKSIVVNS